MYKKYFYPTSSMSLAGIFAKACILPASLNQNQSDVIQSKYENFILLTEKFGCSGCECCVEVMLKKEEENSLVNVNNGFFFYKRALPISRIEKIYFAKEVQAKRTISTINLATAFIPKHIIEYGDHTFDNINISDIVVPEQLVDSIDNEKNSIDNVKSSYDTYNRILGALVLMRTAHEEGCNVSPLYIDTLSKFNTDIENQKKKFSGINKKFHSVIDKPKPFLKQNINIDTLNDLAQKNNQTIIKNKITKMIDPSNLDDNVYICYVLYDHGVGKESRRNKIDKLILNNFTSLKSGKGEACAFYYGYNRGYAAFNNEYGGEKEIVKFKLETLLDYCTIESIFEYSFNKKISCNIDFFDSLLKPAPPRKARNGEYVILDTVIRDKKKVKIFSEEWWTNCLQSLREKNNFNFLGYDFTTSIEQIILRPFAKVIQNELSDEYEETITKLKEEIEKRKEEALSLKQEDYILMQEQKPTTVSGASEIADNVENSQKVLVDSESKKQQEDEIDKIIDICLMKKVDRTKHAKKLGCVVKGIDERAIIKEILKVERNNDNKQNLF